MTTPELQRLVRLDRLLDEALDLGPAEQEVWLARVRTAEPWLADRLAELLADEPALDASGFLQPPTVTDSPPTSLAGRRIGAYVLERPLGRGGMGTVWLARRSDGRFEGRAAIKLLNLPLLDAAGADRFRREGTALARLAHPNIAHLTDAGVADDGQPFLVLEYVDGVRLDQYADERRLSVNERLALLLQVLDAVSHAHGQLIVHRDIKPPNLLVTADGNVKLLDFGIAKLLVSDGAAGERSMLTDAAGSALTPEYAAPEQVTGGPVTVATDVYSLGVLLYVLLTGRHPTGQGAATPAEHLQRLLEVTPVRMSAAASRSAEPGRRARSDVAADRSASPDRLRRLYRGDLDNIAARALKKAPGERYATVGALADDIRRYIRHEPVQARPDTLGYRTRKFIRRNRGAVAAGVVVASLLIATTGYALFQLAQAQRQRDDARVQRDRALFERQRSAASDNFMQVVFSTVGSSERVSAAELLDRARSLLEQQYGDEPRFVARLMMQLASEFHLALGVDAERSLLESSVTYADRSGDPELRATARCKLGLSLSRTYGDTTGANANIDSAQRLLRRVAQPDAQVVASCLLAESHLRSVQNRSDAATRLLDRFDSVAASNPDSASLSAAQDRYDAAVTWFRMGRVRIALAEMQQCDAVLLRLGHNRSMFRLTTLDLHSVALNRLGELRQADSLNAMWIELARLHGPDLKGFVELHAASRALWQGQPDSAVRIWQRRVAQARRDGTLGEATLYPLVAALIAAKQFRDARLRVVEYSRLPDASPEQLLFARGRLAEAEDKPRQARQYYSALLRSLGFPHTRERLQGHWPNVTREARMAFAEGDMGGADSLARQALILAHQNEHDDLRSAEIGRIRLLQARIALARTDSTAAASFVRLALPALEYGLGQGRPETVTAQGISDLLRRP